MNTENPEVNNKGRAFDKVLRAALYARLYSARMGFSLFGFGSMAMVLVNIPSNNLSVELPFAVEEISGSWILYSDGREYQLENLNECVSLIYSKSRKRRNQLNRFNEPV